VDNGARIPLAPKVHCTAAVRAEITEKQLLIFGAGKKPVAAQEANNSL
jgi:hypothetical protein